MKKKTIIAVLVIIIILYFFTNSVKVLNYQIGTTNYNEIVYQTTGVCYGQVFATTTMDGRKTCYGIFAFNKTKFTEENPTLSDKIIISADKNEIDLNFDGTKDLISLNKDTDTYTTPGNVCVYGVKINSQRACDEILSLTLTKIFFTRNFFPYSIETDGTNKTISIVWDGMYSPEPVKLKFSGNGYTLMKD